MVEAWDAEGVQTVAVEAGKSEVTAEGLEPTSTYEFKVVASDGSGEAESDVATYDTQARCFAPLYIVAENKRAHACCCHRWPTAHLSPSATSFEADPAGLMRAASL